MGTFCTVGMWFSFGAVLNSVEQDGAKLIASMFGFGAQKGIICGNGDDACSRGSTYPIAAWGRGSQVDDRLAVFLYVPFLPRAAGGVWYRAW